MSIKRKALGLAAALGLSLAAISPASAASTVDVTINITNSGAGNVTFSITSGSAAFTNLTLNADEVAGSGVKNAGNATFTIKISGDDELYRPGGAVNIKLGSGSDANAYMDLIDPDPTFPGASSANFQIPGRYLSISGLTNPQQSKWTNVGGTSTDPIWAGSTLHTPAGTHGRAPRIAGSATVGQPIYKVGDIGGTFGNPSNAACNVTSGSAIEAWPSTGCGVPAFSEGNVTKQIGYVLDGSGFVEAEHQIQLSLNVPAGVYPGNYKGVLTLETTFT